MEKKLLIKLEMNWADEFDVNSFWVATQDEYDQFLKLITSYNWSENDEIYFGTNEYINFGSTDDLLSSLTSTPITEEFYSQLLTHFGEEYGLIDLNRLAEYVSYKMEE